MLLLLIAAIGGADADAAGPDREVVRYEGKFRADRTAPVRFKLTLKDGRPESGYFVARGVDLLCRDAPEMTIRKLGMEVRFDRGGHFEADYWEIDDDFGNVSFGEVQGRLEGRTIRGSLLLIEIPAAGPVCHSFNDRGSWQAQRVSP